MNVKLEERRVGMEEYCIQKQINTKRDTESDEADKDDWYDIRGHRINFHPTPLSNISVLINFDDKPATKKKNVQPEKRLRNEVENVITWR